MAELHISLENETIGLPYFGQCHDDGNINHGYKPIVHDEHLIDSIPELENEPSMKALVRSINSKDATFETIRCLHYFLLLPDGKTYIREFALGFIFREHRFFNQYSNCLMFAGNLLERMNNGTPYSSFPPRLTIQKAYWREPRIEGWIMDVHIVGTGQTEQDARQSLDAHLTQWSSFF
jgi:hypothetical protein